MLVEALQKHFDQYADKGLLTPSPELLKEATEAFEATLRGVYKEHKNYFPRASALGHEARRLWYMRQNPDMKNSIGVFVSMTGNLWEAVLIYFLKEAGVDIRNVQAGGKAKFGRYAVPGSIDFECKINGEWGVVDAKTCSEYSWKTKWSDVRNLIENDPYGYIPQAAVYEETRGVPFHGWLVKNKGGADFDGNLNRLLKFVSAEPIRDHIQAEKEKIRKKLLEAHKDERPAQCYPVISEYYNPKNKDGFYTGNHKVDNRCAKCPFVGECFPNATQAKRGSMPIYYVGNVVYNVPGVKIVLESKDE